MKEFLMVCYNNERCEIIERIIHAQNAAEAFSIWAEYLEDDKYPLSEYCELSIKRSGEIGTLHL